jgi:endogenous inhibitor of DNA gyrase (YacG/DUF329 family)
MESLRCLICGEVYIGKTRPSNCPFCGTKAIHMVDVEQWTDENETVTSLSDISRANLAHSLQLEVNAGPFYKDASAKAKSTNLQGVFKGLAKVESEHASVFSCLSASSRPRSRTSPSHLATSPLTSGSRWSVRWRLPSFMTDSRKRRSSRA